jgi:hypothetical protein
MHPLQPQIVAALEQHYTDELNRHWAQRIVDENVAVEELIPILQLNNSKAAMRFAWLLGGLLELSPDHLTPVVTQLFNLRHSIDVPHYSRTLAKLLWRCGVPLDIEGEATEALFTWLRDPKEQVSVKVYSLYALLRLSKRHPDLRQELRISIELQSQLDKPSWRHAVGKVMKELK